MNFSATKEELARRRNQKMNHAYNPTHAQLERWDEGYRELERWGRECGVRVTLDDVRRHPGFRLWR